MCNDWTKVHVLREAMIVIHVLNGERKVENFR
jgi:hypothetical protein